MGPGFAANDDVLHESGELAMLTIAIAKDFSRTPGPRFARLGPHSGEAFRQQLEKALKESGSDIVQVVLDGTEGYGSSFLEEAFGGLVRAGGFSPSEISRRVQIIANDSLYETYATEARRYIKDAAKHIAA
jgi:hypothetical protein